MMLSKKYVIYTKRKECEPKWTDWAQTDIYENALKHFNKLKKFGYLAKIVDNNAKEVLKYD